MTKLFFGYGSTLDAATWDGAMPMVPVGPATLPDNCLSFDYRSRRRGCGVLNLKARLGGVVEGYLFQVDDQAVAALDRRDGHPACYRREDVVVLDAAGREVRAFTYRVVPHRVIGFVAPNDAYMASCMAGRGRYGLTTDDVTAAAEGKEALCESVFVYGTLMRGERRASSWMPLTPPCVLLARTFGTLRHHGDYPGLVPGRDGMVEGEFIQFDDVADALERFDRIEGFAGFVKDESLFRRILTDVDVGSGRVRQAWTYETTRPDAPFITGGDWRRVTGTREVALSSILGDHASRSGDFFTRLATVSDGPFGTVCDEGDGYVDILARLSAGGFDERGLCRASGTWTAWS